MKYVILPSIFFALIATGCSSNCQEEIEELKATKHQLETIIADNEHYINVTYPNLVNLTQLSHNVTNINLHLNYWVYSTSIDKAPLNSLIEILDSKLPENIAVLDELVGKWDENAEKDKEKFQKIKTEIADVKEVIELEILAVMPDFESKTDPMNYFMATVALENVNPKLDKILEDVNYLLKLKQQKSDKQR